MQTFSRMGDAFLGVAYMTDVAVPEFLRERAE